MTTISMRAHGKLNLSLEVFAKDGSGLHPIRSLAQSVSWADHLDMTEADDDRLDIVGADLDPGPDNLVWRAIAALRDATGERMPVDIRLVKRLPVAAGMGGGTADAAAALVAYRDLAGLGPVDLEAVGAVVGTDLPMCLRGGLQMMGGYGETLTKIADPADDHWMVCVVPPFELATPAVYGAWDMLGEPSGPEVSGRALPPSLRPYAPLRNDLYPAADAVEPDLDDWRAELAATWDRAVVMSGSGPTLFAYFADEDEAREGAAVAPAAARAVQAVVPNPSGVVRREQ